MNMSAAHERCPLHRVCNLGPAAVHLCIDHLVYVCGRCYEGVGDYYGRKELAAGRHGCFVVSQNSTDNQAKKTRPGKGVVKRRPPSRKV